MRFFWLVIIQIILLTVAFITLIERKFMGGIQKRKGPNLVGYKGLLQPISDGLKLQQKESILPLESNKQLFIGGPVILFYLSLINWLVIPLDQGIAISRIYHGVLFLQTIAEQGVYGVIFSGWSANSKYPLMGSLRSAGQLISYSVTLSLIILIVVQSIGSINLLELDYSQYGLWLIFPLFPLAILYFITLLAETNRPPFDLPEGESELVGGFMTEHSAIGFTYFFLGEYTNIQTNCYFMVIQFFGGSLIFFSTIFTLFQIALVVWVRATLPRIRLDLLLKLGWSKILPLTLAYLLLVPSIIITFDIFPFIKYHFKLVKLNLY